MSDAFEEWLKKKARYREVKSRDFHPKVGDTVTFQKQKWVVESLGEFSEIRLRHVQFGDTRLCYLGSDGYIRDRKQRQRRKVGDRFKYLGQTWVITATRKGPRGGIHHLIEPVPTNYYQQYAELLPPKWVRMSGQDIENVEHLG